MSEKYVIEFDDEKFLLGEHSYRRISGTNALISDDDIKNLIPAESKEEKKTIKDIKHGDMYYFIDSSGSIKMAQWANDSTDKFREGCNNAFLTEDEVAFKIKRLEIIANIQKYVEPLDTQWDGKKPHYELLVQVGEVKRVTVSCSCSFKSGGFYFTTEHDAKKVIDEVGEADLLKYYFIE